MNIVNKICLPLVSIMAVLFIVQPLYAGEIDILVNKLVDKGILTHGEAQQIVTETKEQVRAELIAGKSASVPQWVQNVKLGGDVRLRHQWEDLKKDSVSGRHRARIRFRLGIDTKLADQFKIQAGIITGSADPRSGNQTLEDSFSTKSLNLDYAYVSYQPLTNLTFHGGKMKQSFWKTSDFLWSNDITPEGVAMVFTNKLNSASIFMNSGFFILDESSSKSNEPYLAYFQPGFDWKISDEMSLKAAVAYNLIRTEGWDMDHSAGTNTLVGSNHKYNYDSINPAAQLSFKDPFGGLVPYLAVFGEYINALDPNIDNDGWSLGFKLGESRVNDKGKWQLSYLYRKLERDAWLDCFPDGSAYSGGTNIKGHKLGLSYGLSKNVSAGISYYALKPIKVLSGVSNHKEGSSNDLKLVQTDLSVKF